MGPLVLVVDEDASVRSSVAHALGEEFAVHSAADAAEALAMLDGGMRFAALLLSVGATTAAGVALAEEVRVRYPEQSAHLVLLAPPWSVGAIEELGVAPVLEKPLRTSEVLAAVRRAATA